MNANGKTRGEVAYKAYTDTLPWGSLTWDQLIPQQTAAWEAAANAAVEFKEEEPK